MNKIEEYLNEISKLNIQKNEITQKINELKLKAYKDGLFTIFVKDYILEYLRLYNQSHNTSYVYTNVKTMIAYYDNDGPYGDYEGYYPLSFDRRIIQNAKCETINDILELAKKNDELKSQLKYNPPLLHIYADVKDCNTHKILEPYNLPRDFKHEFDFKLLDFKLKYLDGSIIADKVVLDNNYIKIKNGVNILNNLTYNVNIENLNNLTHYVSKNEENEDPIERQAVINCATRFIESGNKIPTYATTDGMPR